MRNLRVGIKTTLNVATALLALSSLTPARADSGFLYGIRPTGELLIYHNRTLTATPDWNPSGPQVGCGWQGLLTVFSGGDGGIYAIRPDGVLLYYKDFARDGTNGECGQRGWVEPIEIGSGWQSFQRVFSGGDGMIFAIDGSGDLYSYQHLSGRDWSPTSGRKIGTGWGSFLHVLSGGGGVIYAVAPNGDLHYYRYLPEVGFVGASGAKVGRGWNLRSVFGGGDGVVYAIRDNGDLLWYKDLRRDGSNGAGGEQGWHPQSGAVIGYGWNGFKIVIAD